MPAVDALEEVFKVLAGESFCWVPNPPKVIIWSWGGVIDTARQCVTSSPIPAVLAVPPSWSPALVETLRYSFSTPLAWHE